jgi:tRNA wybutosine-synthesizing protein 3
MAKFSSQRKNETIVDLFAGVGYYTLPFLVYAGAQIVHACEWNPNSVTALLENLRKAGVPSTLSDTLDSTMERRNQLLTLQNGEKRKCNVYLGDNNIFAGGGSILRHVADRVCLGLLPSSVGGWPLAVNALKSTGGILHVHENVKEDNIEVWVENCCNTFQQLFTNHYSVEESHVMRTCVVKCNHIERVKSFAPRVLHIVADLIVSWE